MIVKDLPVDQFFVLRERIDGPKVPDQHNPTVTRIVMFYRADHELTESVRIGYKDRADTLVPVRHMGFIQYTEHHDGSVSKFTRSYAGMNPTFISGTTPVEPMEFGAFATIHDEKIAAYHRWIALQEMR